MIQGSDDNLKSDINVLSPYDIQREIGNYGNMGRNSEHIRVAQNNTQTTQKYMSQHSDSYSLTETSPYLQFL